MALINSNAQPPADPTAMPPGGAGAPPAPGAGAGVPPVGADANAPPANVPPVGAAPGSDPTNTDVAAVAAGESQGPGGTWTIDPKAVRAKMQIPPQFQDGYQRLVMAGAQVLFNPQTHKMVMSHIDGQGPVAARLGRGIAGLMLMLFRKSNYKAPAQVLIPAGVDLLTQAAEYILTMKAFPLSQQDLANATRILIATLLVQFGASPDKVKTQLGTSGTADSSGANVDPSVVPDDNDAATGGTGQTDAPGADADEGPASQQAGDDPTEEAAEDEDGAQPPPPPGR